MRAKTTSFFTSNTSSSLLYFFRMLDFITSTFSSQNVRQRGIVVDCWQYTCSYEILRWFVNHHINIEVSYLSQIYFSLKLSFTVRNVCGLISITRPSLNQTKDNSFSFHVFYRLWHIGSFIHSSLDIIYGFALDASESRL